jgi:predicted S18 family serine protease
MRFTGTHETAMVVMVDLGGGSLIVPTMPPQPATQTQKNVAASAAVRFMRFLFSKEL